MDPQRAVISSTRLAGVASRRSRQTRGVWPPPLNVSFSTLRGGHSRESASQLIDVDWLSEMRAEARFAAALQVVFHAEAAQGDSAHGMAGEKLAHQIVPAAV